MITGDPVRRSLISAFTGPSGPIASPRRVDGAPWRDAHALRRAAGVTGILVAASRPLPTTGNQRGAGPAYAYPDGHQVLHGVNLRGERGERVAVLGPNGAAKTTSVLHLNGVLGGGSGRGEVAGLPVEKAHLREVRRRVGVVSRDPDDQLSPPTARQDVAFGPANFGLRGAELDERVYEPSANLCRGWTAPC